MPRDRITVIDNATDTSGFAGTVAAVTEAELRAQLGLISGELCGSLYGHKHIPLLVAGAAVEADRLRDAARRLAFLNPGLVGLAILDSFAASLPFVTTDIPIHSPEIAYLEPGVSGLMLPHTAQEFADAVAALLADPARLRAMALGAAHAARRYTLENMVANVAEGIERCLRTQDGAPLMPQPR